MSLYPPESASAWVVRPVPPPGYQWVKWHPLTGGPAVVADAEIDPPEGFIRWTVVR